MKKINEYGFVKNEKRGTHKNRIKKNKMFINSPRFTLILVIFLYNRCKNISFFNNK